MGRRHTTAARERIFDVCVATWRTLPQIEAAAGARVQREVLADLVESGHLERYTDRNNTTTFWRVPNPTTEVSTAFLHQLCDHLDVAQASPTGRKLGALERLRLLLGDIQAGKVGRR